MSRGRPERETEAETLLFKTETETRTETRDFQLKGQSFGSLPSPECRGLFAVGWGPALRAGRNPATGGRW